MLMVYLAIIKPKEIITKRSRALNIVSMFMRNPHYWDSDCYLVSLVLVRWVTADRGLLRLLSCLPKLFHQSIFIIDIVKGFPV